MKCPKCGAELASGVSFCRECGAKIEKKRFCRECGAALAEGVKFCSNCGAKTDISPATATSESEPSIRRTKFNDYSSNRYGNVADKEVFSDYRTRPTASRTYSSSKKYKAKKQTRKIVPIISAVGLIIALIIVIGFLNDSSSSKDTSSDVNIGIEKVVPTEAVPKPTNNTIIKGSQYAFMSDEWDVYIATAISDSIIKIEHWDKSLSSNRKASFSEDIGSFKINDAANGFEWIDAEHTAFSMVFRDENNSRLKKAASHIFTINISDSNVFKGSDYNETIACYSYTNDDWHMYLAIPLTESLIKIECWYRSSSFSWESFIYSWDWCVIDTKSSDTDFAWTDAEHTSFTITTKDPQNSNYWKSKSFVAFVLENDQYKYKSVSGYLSDIQTQAKQVKDGFSESTNTTITVGSSNFSIPDYWKTSKSSSDLYDASAESSGKAAVLEIRSLNVNNDNVTVNFDTLKAVNDNGSAVKVFASAFASYSEASSEVFDNGVIKGFIYRFNFVQDNLNGKAKCLLYPSESDRCWVYIYLMETNNTDYTYFRDFDKIINSITIGPHTSVSEPSPQETTSVPETPAPTITPAPETPPPEKKSGTVSYSTNTKATVKNGNSGVYSYKKSGSYDVYYIIDFDDGYVYWFTDGNGDTSCDRLRIESGNLNDVLIITYHDGGDTWSYGLHFKFKNQPDHMIMEDNNHFEYDFYTTDLDEALLLKKSKTIHDY